MPRLPSIVDHRRFLAADIGAGAAADESAAVRTADRPAARRFLFQDRAASVVFVAQVNIDFVDADRPRGDERAFDETVRVALEVPAVLERARLAFVDVDREEPRRGLGSDGLPFAARGKARAAEATQARALHHRDPSSPFLPSMQALASA
jgi:hypothetical protein